MSVTFSGTRCTWRSQSRDFSQELCQQMSPTAQLSDTLVCEISADRQLPGSEQINSISPGAFFNQRGNRRSGGERSERDNISFKEEQNSPRMTFSYWLT